MTVLHLRAWLLVVLALAPLASRLAVPEDVEERASAGGAAVPAEAHGEVPRGPAAGAVAAKLEFHARDIGVADALGQLQRPLRKSIVVAADVKQRYSGDLRDVTPDEAVRAICRSAGLTVHEERSVLYVGVAEVQSHTFHFPTLRAEEMAALVHGSLSAKGALVATDVRAKDGASAADGSDPADHPDEADSDQGTITVFDEPRNLNAMAELVRAFDSRARATSGRATAGAEDERVARTGERTGASADHEPPPIADWKPTAGPINGPEPAKSPGAAPTSGPATSSGPVARSKPAADTQPAESTKPTTQIVAPATPAPRSAPLGIEAPRDAERLARSYVDIARRQLESGGPESALILLDAASALTPGDPAIDCLRKQAGRAWTAASRTDVVDELILNQALSHAAVPVVPTVDGARKPAR